MKFVSRNFSPKASIWGCVFLRGHCVVGFGKVPLHLAIRRHSDVVPHQIFYRPSAAENFRRGVEIHGRPGAELRPISFSFNASHFKIGMMDLMIDLGAKVENRRKKTKRSRIQGDLRNLGFEKKLPFFPLFESYIGVITMMILEKAVAFPPLMENLDHCANPKDLNRLQPVRRTRR